jgi:hypothetical protein
LASDPLAGPFTMTSNITAGTTLQIRVNQVTIGSLSFVNVSFGDGIYQNVSSLKAGSPVIISHNYTTSGTFIISAKATPSVATNVKIAVNNITVTMLSPSIYNCKYHFFSKNI